MIHKKNLIKTLRKTANILEKSDLRYAYDRYLFIKMYEKCTKLLDNFKVQKLNNNDKCINL